MNQVGGEVQGNASHLGETVSEGIRRRSEPVSLSVLAVSLLFGAG